MEVRNVSAETCAWCGGKFPGPGVGWRGKVYCCDRCITMSERRSVCRFMLTRVLPVAGLLASAGALAWAGWHNGERRSAERLGRAVAQGMTGRKWEEAVARLRKAAPEYVESAQERAARLARSARERMPAALKGPSTWERMTQWLH